LSIIVASKGVVLGPGLPQIPNKPLRFRSTPISTFFPRRRHSHTSPRWQEKEPRAPKPTILTRVTRHRLIDRSYPSLGPSSNQSPNPNQGLSRLPRTLPSRRLVSTIKQRQRLLILLHFSCLSISPRQPPNLTKPSPIPEAKQAFRKRRANQTWLVPGTRGLMQPSARKRPSWSSQRDTLLRTNKGRRNSRLRRRSSTTALGKPTRYVSLPAPNTHVSVQQTHSFLQSSDKKVEDKESGPVLPWNLDNTYVSGDFLLCSVPDPSLVMHKETLTF